MLDDKGYSASIDGLRVRINLYMNKIPRHRNIYFIYSFLFIVAGIVIFFPLLVRHSGFVGIGDNFNQDYPTLVYMSGYYRKFIMSLFNGDITTYSTSLGFGDNVIGVLCDYGLGDVFMLISIFFPAKYLSYGYSLITVARLYLSGITFVFYGKYKKLPSKALFLGALMYSYSFYAIGIGITSFTFSTAPVYFPLIIYGIDKIMNEYNKNHKLLNGVLIAALFLQSLCGFYYLYMDIIVSLAYFFIEGICCIRTKQQKISTILHTMLAISVNFCIGIGMSCFLLLPIICDFMQCNRHGDVSFSLTKLFSLPSRDFLHNSINNIVTPPRSAYTNGLYIPIIAIIVIVHIIMHFREKKYAKKILYLTFSLYSIFFPTVGMIFNGFSYNTSRWTYIFYFFLSYIVASEYNTITAVKISGHEIIADIIAIVLWMVSVVSLNELNESQIMRTIIFLCIWIGMLYIFTRKTTFDTKQLNGKTRSDYKCLSFVLCIIFACFMFYAPQKIGGSGVGAGFKGLNFVDSEIRSSKLAQECSKDTTDEFYRYDYNDTSLDAPLMLGANTTYLYYSMCNGSIYNVFNQLRISPAIMHTFTLQGLDGRQALETLMSVKTYATDTDNWDTTQNKYFLPLGFTYEKAVSEKTVESIDQLQKMNVMMSDVIVGNDKVGKIAKVDNASEPVDIISDCTEQQIPIKITYGSDIIRNGNKIKVNDGSTIRVEFTPLQNQETGDELYLYLRNLTSDPSFKYDISLAGKTIRLRDKKDMWYLDNNFDYLVQVQNAASSGVINIVFQNAGEYTLNDIELVENSIGSFEEKYEKLGKDTLKDTVIDGNSVSGSISLDKGKWLFLSLPYDKGWNCKIDGIDTEILRANYSFMTVYIPDGVHNVRFCYETPGLKVGLLLSIISLLIFIVLCIIGRKNEKREN